MATYNINNITKELILSAQKGDIHARNKLITMVIPQIRFCIRDKQNEDDFLQEVVLRIIKYLNSFDVNKGNFKHWVSVVTKNYVRRTFESKKHLKTENFTQTFSSMPFEDYEEFFKRSYHEELQEEQDQNKMISTVKKLAEDVLPRSQKEMFKMFCFEGLTHPEIAQYTGTTVPNTKSQVSRARQRIVNELNK